MYAFSDTNSKNGDSLHGRLGRACVMLPDQQCSLSHFNLACGERVANIWTRADRLT